MNFFVTSDSGCDLYHFLQDVLRICAATSLNLAFKHIDDLARGIRTQTLDERNATKPVVNTVSWC